MSPAENENLCVLLKVTAKIKRDTLIFLGKYLFCVQCVPGVRGV